MKPPIGKDNLVVRCENCKFYEEIKRYGDLDPRYGNCKRMPPQIVLYSDSDHGRNTPRAERPSYHLYSQYKGTSPYATCTTHAYTRSIEPLSIPQFGDLDGMVA